MTISEIDTLITLYTGADGNYFTQSQRLLLVNTWMHKIENMILQVIDESDFDDLNLSYYPIALLDLVADQQDYRFDTAQWKLIGREGGINATASSIKPLKILRVETKLDGSNWKKATPFDIGERIKSIDSNELGDFVKSNPYYDVFANALWLYPIPDSNITGGLKMWFIREIDEFTNAEYTAGTKEPGFAEVIHQMIPIGVSIDWLISKNADDIRIDRLKSELRDLVVLLREAYGDKQKDRQFILKPYYENYN